MGGELEKDFYRQAALQHCQQEGFDPAEVLDERTGRTRLTQLSLDLEILDMQLAALRMAHTLKLKEQGQ